MRPNGQGAIHVCSLDRIGATTEQIGAQWLITLLNEGTAVTRPTTISSERHLWIAMSDIVDPTDGHILPAKNHVTRLLRFALQWDRRSPRLLQCIAGVSRSTAAAFVVACALSPERAEADIAREIRELSPTATPNARLVAIGDSVLGRSGRMIEAIAAIGRGESCATGHPFTLQIG